MSEDGIRCWSSSSILFKVGLFVGYQCTHQAGCPERCWGFPGGLPSVLSHEIRGPPHFAFLWVPGNLNSGLTLLQQTLHHESSPAPLSISWNTLQANYKMWNGLHCYLSNWSQSVGLGGSAEFHDNIYPNRCTKIMREKPVPINCDATGRSRESPVTDGQLNVQSELNFYLLLFNYYI